MQLGLRIGIPASIALLLAVGWFRAPEEPTYLHGLWARADDAEPSSALRFYYFHTDGHGLYRYGRKNLNNTHRYDYRATPKAISLSFKKTGLEITTPYHIEEEADGTRWLILEHDPREPEPVRYRYMSGPISSVSDDASDHPFARMWTHMERDARGGLSFAIYQLQAPADGRGHGWYHQGDFDEWSTEALSYALDGSTLHLHFLERDERASTPSTRIDGDTAALQLDRDPRNFWHVRVYDDGGRSFQTNGFTDLDRRIFAHAR